MADGLTLVPLPGPSVRGSCECHPSLSRDSDHYLISSSDDGNYHQPKRLIDHNDKGGSIIVCPNIMPCLIAIVAGFPPGQGVRNINEAKAPTECRRVPIMSSSG